MSFQPKGPLQQPGRLTPEVFFWSGFSYASLPKRGFSSGRRVKKDRKTYLHGMQFRQIAVRIYRNIYGRWALHFLFWIFNFGVRYYVQLISFNSYKSYTKGVVVISFLSTLNIAIVYYIIVGFIYPRWLKRKK